MCNARSVRPKSQEFFTQINNLGIILSLVSETHLTSGDRFNGPSYHIYRLDRSNGRRGEGVALVVRRGVSHRLLSFPTTRSVEAVAVELFVSSRVLVVVSMYFPGSSDPRILSTFRRDLEVLSNLGPNAFNSRLDSH